jgi:hypothetical protein
VTRAALALLLVLAWSSAEAQSTGAPPEPEVTALPAAYWSDMRVRPFVAGVADAGGLVRTKLMLGYGKPHWTWGGVEAEGVTTSEVAFSTVRARLALLVADVAIAYRKTWTYRRGWVERERSYTDADLTRADDLSYHSLDLSLWGLLPVGSGYFDWQLETIHLLGGKRAVDLYEESLRVVMRPPWATATRLGYVQTFMKGKLGVGVLAEWLWPGPRSSIYRVGPLVSYAFTPHWDLALLASTVVRSPDSLGPSNRVWGTLRVRFRFALGERKARLHAP